MTITVDCQVCGFVVRHRVEEKTAAAGPLAMNDEIRIGCPNCGTRYRITSLRPIWIVRDINITPQPANVPAMLELR